MPDVVFTRRAAERLDEITMWTYEEFGPRQAEKYQTELISRCNAIGDGLAVTQSCSLLMPPGSLTEMRFGRAGRHIVIFVERDDAVVILSLLHSNSDLASQLERLATGIGES